MLGQNQETGFIRIQTKTEISKHNTDLKNLCGVSDKVAYSIRIYDLFLSQSIALRASSARRFTLF